MKKAVIEKRCGCVSIDGADAVECYVHAQVGAFVVFLCGVFIWAGMAILLGPQ